MAKAYVQLPDKSSMFYDQMGRQKIVRDRIELLELNKRVQEAISAGQLIKLDKEVGRELYQKQQDQQAQVEAEKEQENPASKKPVKKSSKHVDVEEKEADSLYEVDEEIEDDIDSEKSAKKSTGKAK